MLLRLSPAGSSRYTVDLPTAYHRGLPTFGELDRVYGSNTSAALVVSHINDLQNFCGVLSMTKDRMLELSRMVTQEYSWMTVGEWMLFCFRFKSGRYDKFYGSASANTVMRSLGQFRLERLADLNMLEAQRERERMLSERDRWRREAVSYEEAKAALGLKNI